jgi:hypothetical protein
MTRLRLKSKMIIGSLAMAILVLVTTAVAVSIVINAQYREAAGRDIVKTINIVREDVITTQEKMLADTRQIATINTMGAKVKFLTAYKGQPLTGTTEYVFREAAADILRVGRVSNLWIAGVYDVQGDVVAFSIRKNERPFFLPTRRIVPRGYSDMPFWGPRDTSARPEWVEDGDFKDLPVDKRFKGSRSRH